MKFSFEFYSWLMMPFQSQHSHQTLLRVNPRFASVCPLDLSIEGPVGRRGATLQHFRKITLKKNRRKARAGFLVGSHFSLESSTLSVHSRCTDNVEDLEISPHSDKQWHILLMCPWVKYRRFYRICTIWILYAKYQYPKKQRQLKQLNSR